MNPEEYRYSQEHEWVCVEAPGRARIGITGYAQSQLGDIVFLDLPEVDSQVTQFTKMGEIETVKAVSDLSRQSAARCWKRIGQRLIIPRSLMRTLTGPDGCCKSN